MCLIVKVKADVYRCPSVTRVCHVVCIEMNSWGVTARLIGGVWLTPDGGRGDILSPHVVVSRYAGQLVPFGHAHRVRTQTRYRKGAGR